MQNTPDGSPSASRVPVTPAAELLKWLDAQKRDIAEPVKLRVPVTITFTNANQIAIARTTIGAAADALQIRLDDSALGISLMDRIRGKCPGTTCAVWIEGNWRGVDDGRP